MDKEPLIEVGLQGNSEAKKRDSALDESSCGQSSSINEEGYRKIAPQYQPISPAVDLLEESSEESKSEE